MGQCTAWPSELYSVEEVHTPRLADTVVKQGVVHRSHIDTASSSLDRLEDRAAADDAAGPSLWSRLTKWASGGPGGGAEGEEVATHLRSEGEEAAARAPSRRRPDVWKEALSRHNSVVLVRLRPGDCTCGGRRCVEPDCPAAPPPHHHHHHHHHQRP
jgi:hypothetical protein